MENKQNNINSLEDLRKELLDELNFVSANTLESATTYDFSQKGTTEEQATDRLMGIIQALITTHEQQARREGVEETFKNVGSWYKVPIREGMKAESVKGLGDFKGGGCEVCGGTLVEIRGRHPKESNRKVCPTCAVEIIESILDNCNNRQAYTDKFLEENPSA